MALKKLSSAEMVSLSGPWVEADSAERALLTSIPETEPIVGRIEKARAQLLAVQPKPDESEGRRQKELSAELETEDQRHDDLVRGILGMLQALTYLTTDTELIDQYTDAMNALFPEGADVVQRSYREEAGHGALREARITREIKTLLRTIATPEGTLWDAVAELQKTAKRIGELEHQRGATPAKVGSAQSDMVLARNQWIRAVNALSAALALAEVDPATGERVLGALHRAEARADQKRSDDGEEGDATTVG